MKKLLIISGAVFSLIFISFVTINYRLNVIYSRVNPGDNYLKFKELYNNEYNARYAMTEAGEQMAFTIGFYPLKKTVVIQSRDTIVDDVHGYIRVFDEIYRKRMKNIVPEFNR